MTNPTQRTTEVVTSRSPHGLVGHLVQQVGARHQGSAPVRETGVGDVAVHERNLPPDLLLSVVVVAHGDHVGGQVHADHALGGGHRLGQHARARAHAAPEVDDHAALLDLVRTRRPEDTAVEVKQRGDGWEDVVGREGEET